MSDGDSLAEVGSGPDDPVVILTTCGSNDEDNWILSLVEHHVVSCVTKLPGATSHFWWDSKLTVEAETIWVLKTIRRQIPSVWSLIREHHPYSTPEFLVLPVSEVNVIYWKWMLSGLLL